MRTDGLAEGHSEVAAPIELGYGTFEWDVTADSIVWSDEMYSIHGVAPDYRLRDPRSFLQFVHPDDLELVRNFLEYFLDGGEPHPIEYRIQLPDGEVRHLLGTNAVIQTKDGKPSRVLGTVRDISELRRVSLNALLTDKPPQAPGLQRAEEALVRSEQRFRALIENTYDVISVFGVDGTILYSTPSRERVLGFSKHETVGRKGADFIHPDDQAMAYRAFAQTLRGPGSTASVVFRSLHKDGSWRAMEVTLTNLLEHQAVGGIVANMRDITERRQADEALRQAQKMEAIGRLAGGVAHDFNNLLTVILGEAEMSLDERAAPGELQDSLKRIRAAGERAGDLTQRLLAFSRREIQQKEVLDLNALVSRTQEMLRRLIEADVSLDFELESDLWRLCADPSQIEQLIVNLVVNARDSMPEGGTVHISTRNVTLDDDELEAFEPAEDASSRDPEPVGNEFVRLDVLDTGTGISKDLQTHIFEPFFTTKGNEGTGLGLATCYSVARQHGGHIGVDSTEGQGTTVTVYLPRCCDEVDVAVVAPEPEQVTGKETILVVEDESAVREITGEILSRTGHVVLSAADAAEALSIVEEHGEEIDLLLTDVVLPGMGGRELAEEVVRLYPSIRVLFVSGYTADAILRRGVIAQEFELLPKPFLSRQLTTRVREVLDRE